jgi:hypothetical protein
VPGPSVLMCVEAPISPTTNLCTLALGHVTHQVKGDKASMPSTPKVRSDFPMASFTDYLFPCYVLLVCERMLA